MWRRGLVVEGETEVKRENKNKKLERPMETSKLMTILEEGGGVCWSWTSRG